MKYMTEFNLLEININFNSQTTVYVKFRIQQSQIYFIIHAKAQFQVHLKKE